MRIVAATNLNMQKAIKKNKFREDLYYRLSTIEINIPPLRNRKDDIHLLFRKFSSDFAQRYKMPSIKLEDDAIKTLINYRWDGNIRQLKARIENIKRVRKLASKEARIQRKQYLRHEAEKKQREKEISDDQIQIVPITEQSNNDERKSGFDYAEEIKVESLSLHDKELELIKKSLEKHKGRRKLAAKELGISERTLYRKIKQFNL